MERLKVLGTWVILVIAFYLFSNGLIYIALHNGSVKSNNTVNNTQTITQKNNLYLHKAIEKNI